MLVQRYDNAIIRSAGQEYINEVDCEVTTIVIHIPRMEFTHNRTGIMW